MKKKGKKKKTNNNNKNPMMMGNHREKFSKHARIIKSHNSRNSTTKKKGEMSPGIAQQVALKNIFGV